MKKYPNTQKKFSLIFLICFQIALLTGFQIAHQLTTSNITKMNTFNLRIGNTYLRLQEMDIIAEDIDRIEDKAEPKNNFMVPLNNDSDSDGMPDEWEIANGLNPNVDDSQYDDDFDDLVNIDEYLYGCDPWNSDTDGDHFNDGFEVRKGTDPANPKDHPVRVWLIILIILVSGGVLVVIGWLINLMIRVSKENETTMIKEDKRKSKKKRK